jgi:hypothetical protein
LKLYVDVFAIARHATVELVDGSHELGKFTKYRTIGARGGIALDCTIAIRRLRSSRFRTLHSFASPLESPLQKSQSKRYAMYVQ